VAVVVDKTRRDHPTLGVDRAFGGAAQFADLGNPPASDPEISAEGRHAGAVDDPAVLDQQIIRHRYPFLL
jgi:hypothetical protein